MSKTYSDTIILNFHLNMYKLLINSYKGKVHIKGDFITYGGVLGRVRFCH